MDNRGWLVLDIGCLECGVGTEVVGIFLFEENAKVMAAARRQSTPGTTDHAIKIFEVSLPPKSIA